MRAVRVDTDYDRKTRAQTSVRRRLISIQNNLYRNTLRNFREVPCRIVRGQERELRSARRSNFFYSSPQNHAGNRVNSNFRDVAPLDPANLVLQKVCLYPHIALDQRDYLGTRAHKLSRPHQSLAHDSVFRRHDFRIAEIGLRQRQRSLLHVHRCAKLKFLRVEHRSLAPLRFDLRLSTRQLSPRLGQIGLATGQLSICGREVSVAGKRAGTDSFRRPRPPAPGSGASWIPWRLMLPGVCAPSWIV